MLQTDLRQTRHPGHLRRNAEWIEVQQWNDGLLKLVSLIFENQKFLVISGFSGIIFGRQELSHRLDLIVSIICTTLFLNV